MISFIRKVISKKESSVEYMLNNVKVNSCSSSGSNGTGSSGTGSSGSDDIISPGRPGVPCCSTRA